jgi:hypothetical protein
MIDLLSAPLPGLKVAAAGSVSEFGKESAMLLIKQAEAMVAEAVAAVSGEVSRLTFDKSLVDVVIKEMVTKTRMPTCASNAQCTCHPRQDGCER